MKVVMKGIISSVFEWGVFELDTGRFIGYSDDATTLDYGTDGRRLPEQISVEVVDVDTSAWD